MKKFLVLSAVVGLAGIGVAFAGRQSDPAATVVETASDSPTSTTGAPVIETTSTTARKVAAKVAVKATTTTRPAAVSSPTTATTSASATTTTAAPTTTTTSVATVTPTCTVAADNPTVSGGSSQTVRVTSNMPTARVKIEMAYPKFGTNKPNPRQTYSPTTDTAGSVTQTFLVSDWSTVPVTVLVQFYGPTPGTYLGGPACRTTFISTEA
jgi:hypothetical protein